MTALVWFDGEAVDRLAELDLTTEIFERAIRKADAEASTCTALDPLNLAGILRWGRTTRFLREELVARGWGYDNPLLLARTIHPGGEFAIVASSGDELTGTETKVGPATKYPKGYATIRAVEANSQMKLDLEGLPSDITGGAVRGDSISTWFLLYHVEREGIRAELSLPDGVDGREITSWYERIVLPVLPRDDGGVAGEETPSSPVDDEDYVVDVSRR